MPRTWTPADLLQLAGAYQPAAILAAAADLDLFSHLAASPHTAASAAATLHVDPRALTILLDALASLGLLDKLSDRYTVPPSLTDLLTPAGRGSVLAMCQHQANCLRRWADLARIIQAGHPAPRTPSVRGEDADYAAFIEAMDNISAPAAPQVVGDLQPLPFNHLLDVGGASGTWTLAFLASQPAATATIFDLPHVIPQARARITAAGQAHRIRLVAGDYLVDPLPPGADLAFLGAIVHSLPRELNRLLFARTFAALVPGGRILLRDCVMDPSRTTPPYGALFAVNMLANTDAGTTFTFDELREDLQSAGFRDARILRPDPGMNCILAATRPE